MVVIGTGLVGAEAVLADMTDGTIGISVAADLETLDTGEIAVCLADGILGCTESIASVRTFGATTGIVDDGGRGTGGAVGRRIDVAAALGTLHRGTLSNETGFTVFLETGFDDAIATEGIGAMTGIITETVL